MNAPLSPPTIERAPSPEVTLRRLFLTVFLRGQSARGLTKETVPKSLAVKLGLTLLMYSVLGLVGLFLFGQPVFVLSAALHAMTFFALGMFIASSAGEALFNKEESEILMHRPVTSQMLLRAKASVLVQVSLYLAGAVNLAGMVVGALSSGGGLLFPFVHALSTIEEALFCVGVVVLVYQVCLRWFGRERIEGVLTTMQVVVVIMVTIVPQFLSRAFSNGSLSPMDLRAWWLKLLPPTWFASLDDAVVGSRSGTSWLLAGVGLAATGLILWLAFGKLADAYQTGQQTLGESRRTNPKQKVRRRLAYKLTEIPPLSWFLRDSVARASFLLVAAYMARDRDVKLRLYPGIAPMMLMPFVLLISSGTSDVSTMGGGVMLSISGCYTCIVPMMALNLLRYSQQYRAADAFLAAPISGPGPLLQGARTAVLFFLSLPMLLSIGIYIYVTHGLAGLTLLLPGAIVLPVYAMIPGALGNGVPLSNPQEEAKGASNVLVMFGSMFGAIALGIVATVFQAAGNLAYFLIGEALVSAVLCLLLQAVTAKRRWRMYD